MVNVKLIIVALAASVSALGVSPSSSHEEQVMIVQKAITTLIGETLDLTKAVDAFDGKPADVGPVAKAETTLELELEAAVKDAKATTQLSATDSGTILAALIEPLGPDVQAALKAIEQKAAAFKAAKVDAVIKNDLNNLKNTAYDFHTALYDISDPSKKAGFDQLRKEVDSSFDTAIAAF